MGVVTQKTEKQKLKLLKRVEADALERLKKTLRKLNIDSSEFRTINNRVNQYCRAYTQTEIFLRS